MWPDDEDSDEKKVAGYERPLWILLGMAAVGIVAGAVFIMVKIDESSRSQGGQF